MDYKHEYEEMVRRCKELHGSGNALTKAQMEIVCPQLAESEDERIRKHIIEILNRLAPCHWDGNEKARCIAYLEKQKEQKPAEWSRKDKNIHYYLCKLLRENWDKVDKGSCLDDAIAWFEELPERIFPHSWEPSDDQMNALNCAIADVVRFSKRGGRQVEFENEPYYRALLSLYDDLKKLL